jgi:hypothetical protein
MKEDQLQRIVSEVIKRLAPRLGADGSRGLLVAVFTGATVAFSEAIQQVRSLILDGFRIQLAFSPAAEQLYGQVARGQLAGFPHVGFVDSSNWLSDLRSARTVVVPLLSVNTVSKISLLIADNLATNLILHALFMGKAVIVARNGADPAGRGREQLGFHKGSLPLQQALLTRLQTVAQYGCVLTDVERLRDAVNGVAATENSAKAEGPAAISPSPCQTTTFSHTGKVVTAAHVLSAHRLGADLALSEASLVTPLARDLAMKHGVAFVKANEH